MDNKTLNQIVEASGEVCKKPTINAELISSKEGIKIQTEFNTTEKNQAVLMAATIAAELIENRADYKMFCKVLRKVCERSNT